MSRIKTTNEDQTLGTRVKQARLSKKLSANDLAELIGVSKAYVHQIEAGQCRRPSAEVLFNMAKILDTSIGYLLGKVEENKLEEGVIQIPDGLKQFAAEEGLTAEEMNMLAGIKYRSKKPKEASDWRYIWESIKRSV